MLLLITHIVSAWSPTIFFSKSTGPNLFKHGVYHYHAVNLWRIKYSISEKLYSFSKSKNTEWNSHFKIYWNFQEIYKIAWFYEFTVTTEVKFILCLVPDFLINTAATCRTDRQSKYLGSFWKMNRKKRKKIKKKINK
jgi:hypothetical protein